MTNEITSDAAAVARALGMAGQHEHLRGEMFELLRRAEEVASDRDVFRDEVRWPIVLALLDGGPHLVHLANGLKFEVTADSRIERALLLSPEARPDHVWEPQTTKLLVALAAEVDDVVVGGAYIGDQVLPMARALADRREPGVVHAFEPMAATYERLLRNLELNAVVNVEAHQLALWDSSDALLGLEGHLALASSTERPAAGEARVRSITIADYAESRGLPSVGLIMLDTEGGEERALLGAEPLLDTEDAPNVVFEVHRSFVDWSAGLENTSVIRFLTSLGYDVYAIRDIHGNHPMAHQPIEVLPADHVYLEGPPHGFNMLATKDPELLRRLDLRVVRDVSPKLLQGRDPALHAPVGGVL